jgi:hypothetical protein
MSCSLCGARVAPQPSSETQRPYCRRHSCSTCAYPTYVGSVTASDGGPAVFMRRERTHAWRPRAIDFGNGRGPTSAGTDPSAPGGAVGAMARLARGAFSRDRGDRTKAITETQGPRRSPRSLARRRKRSGQRLPVSTSKWTAPAQRERTTTGVASPMTARFIVIDRCNGDIFERSAAPKPPPRRDGLAALRAAANDRGGTLKISDLAIKAAGSASLFAKVQNRAFVTGLSWKVFRSGTARNIIVQEPKNAEARNVGRNYSWPARTTTSRSRSDGAGVLARHY